MKYYSIIIYIFVATNKVKTNIMKKILAFSGSNSSKSINQTLINYLGKEFGIKTQSLQNWDIPIYSQDYEEENGSPQQIKDFIESLKSYDGVVIATNEHNGYMSAFFKNILDWMSRTEMKSLEGKTVFVLSSSPGGGGGASANANLSKILGYFGGNVTDNLTIGSFYDVFDLGSHTFKNEEVKSELHQKMQGFIKA